MKRHPINSIITISLKALFKIKYYLSFLINLKFNLNKKMGYSTIESLINFVISAGCLLLFLKAYKIIKDDRYYLNIYNYIRNHILDQMDLNVFNLSLI